MNFIWSIERIAAVERFLTRERLSYYLTQSEGDIASAIGLYELNMKVSAVLYVPVQGLEVLLRNAMNEQLRARFGPDWHDLSSLRLHYPQQADIGKAVASIEGEVTNGAVVAELPLGFWAALLNTENDNEVWRKALYLAFPHRPKGTERKSVHGAINSIRRLRNRIARHEKILHRDLEADHDRILEIAGWICTESQSWIASLSEFSPTMLPAGDAKLPLETPSQVSAGPPLVKAERPTLNGRARLSAKGP